MFFFFCSAHGNRGRSAKWVVFESLLIWKALDIVNTTGADAHRNTDVVIERDTYTDRFRYMSRREMALEYICC